MVYLPEGYRALKEDFGAILKAERRRRRLKQSALAQDVGIARETLSRIESGRAPRGSILLALLDKLEMDIADVADAGRTDRRLVFTGGARGDDLLAIGQAILGKRRHLKFSLDDAAAVTCLSSATLSRLERGQSPRSRVLRELNHSARDFEHRRVSVAHAPLREFLANALSDLD